MIGGPEQKETTVIRLAEEDVTFARAISFYMIMYVRAQNMREKLSWLRGAVAMCIEGLKGSEEGLVDEEDITELSKMYKRIEEIAEVANWELFDLYRFGRLDLISDDDYKKVAKIFNELDSIRDKLLAVLYKARLLEINKSYL